MVMLLRTLSDVRGIFYSNKMATSWTCTYS
jgi:hypothetical protein